MNFSEVSFWKNSNIITEVVFKAALSGGKGGQHVNKTNTKVELYWTPENSLILDEIQKKIIQSKLRNKLSKEGILRIICEEERSQLKNKVLVMGKFYALLATCFKIVKPRKKSNPTKASIKKRLTNKSIRKEVKKNRQRPS